MTSQTEAPGVSELFVEIAMWAGEHGAVDLANKPGPWEGVLGEFHIAINAHREDVKTTEGLTVPPMSMAVNAPKYLGAVMLLAASGGIGAPGMEADVLKALAAAKGAR
jgi:hypothetical protein